MKQSPVDWQPYLARVDVILESKGQSKLTQNESQNLANNWQNIFATDGAFMVQLPPFAAQALGLGPKLNKALANATYDVLKASRGDSYK